MPKELKNINKNINGIILIDKPEGMRSTECVNKIKHLLNTRVGHAGTLDSTASGLLVVLTGSATRLFDYFMTLPKLYRVNLQAGYATDTGDYSGNIIFKPDKDFILNNKNIDDLLPRFYGWRLQRPPEISALKIKGVPAYKLARAGQNLNLKPRMVFIERIKRISSFDNNNCVELEILCGRGTYVRSIVRDIGEYLGCGAFVKNLRRISIGNFCVDSAKDINSIIEKDDINIIDLNNFKK